MAWYDVPENEALCGNCEHFVRHYVMVGDRFAPILRGHCTSPRNKTRQACDACDRFERRR